MTPVIESCDDEPGSPAPPQEGEDRREILIDIDAEGELTSNDPKGLALLAMVAGEILQHAPVLGRTINPRVLADVDNRGLFMLDQLPIFMLLLQASTGELPFESDEAREVLHEQVGPDLAAYRAYAARILRLRESFGVDTVFSCLEDPLAAEARLDRALQSIEQGALWEQYREKLTAALVGSRADWFDRWTVPPLGLMVLGLASGLDDLPGQVAQLRRDLLKLRQRLIALQQSRIAALGATGSLDDRGYREVMHIDQQLQKAYAAFDSALQDSRRAPAIRRAEWVFNLPKLVGGVLSAGIGSASALIDLLKLRRRNDLGYLTGLHRSLSFIQQCDQQSIAEIAERYLARPAAAWQIHAGMLRLAGDTIESCALRRTDGSEVGDALIMTIEDERREIPHRMLWAELVRNDDLRRLLLHPHSD
jgi:hypothetical protein